MPLPLYSPPTIQPIEPIKPVNAKLWEPVPKKQILGHFTHKKMEDRISQRTWYRLVLNLFVKQINLITNGIAVNNFQLLTVRKCDLPR